MKYGYEKILNVQKACNVSFEEADRALRKSKGDESAARLYVLRRKKSAESSLVKGTSALANVLTYRLRIIKGQKVYLNLSMGIVLLLVFVLLLFSGMPYGRPWAPIIGLGIVSFFTILLSGCSILIIPQKTTNEDEPVELVESSPMDEDDVLETYTENEVSQENGQNIIEIE